MMKSIAYYIYMAAKGLANRAGYDFSIKRIRIPGAGGLVNLNVGAGKYEIPGFISLDFFSDHYYSDEEGFNSSRVSYDIRADSLPFSDSSVDNIYISHVIEHVEDEAVEKFVCESYRVLKPGGCLRIATPDGPFLFSVSQFENDYWIWSKKLHLEKASLYDVDWDDLSQYDYLVRSFLTQRMRFYRSRVVGSEVFPGDCYGLGYEELVLKLKEGVQYRKEHPGDHINSWSFSRIRDLGRAAGFSYVIESKYRGSVSAVMQSEFFDATSPQQSLYVDMVK